MINADLVKDENLSVTFGKPSKTSHIAGAFDSVEESRMVINDKQEEIVFNPDQLARSTEIQNHLLYQDDSNLLSEFEGLELTLLKQGLSADKHVGLLLEAVAFKNSIRPQFGSKTHEEIVETLKQKYIYVESFTLDRLIGYIKTSKDLCKVYYIITFLNFNKSKILTAKNVDFKGLLWRLIYTTENKGWMADDTATYLLQNLYCFNEIFCFGINFVFVGLARIPQQFKRSLTKFMLTCISTSLREPLPVSFTDHLFHNCINLAGALDEAKDDAVLAQVHAVFLKEIGVIDLERNSVCSGLKRLYKYLKFATFD